MKILHIVEALGGGVYSYFKDLNDFFNQEELKDKHEVIIAYNDKRNEIIPEKIKTELGGNFQLIKIDMCKELNPIKDLISTIELAKTIRKHQPDVIHLHSSKASIIGRWASFISFKKHKIFYTPHGYAFLRNDISSFKQTLFKTIEKYTQTFFGGTTIACGDTEFEIAKTLGKSTLVRNGIPVDKIKKFVKPKQNNQLTLGIIGRISHQKNPDLFNEIALKYPQHHFIWIGDGDLKNKLTAPNIEITGWFFTAEEVYLQLNRIDLFLQTSLWEGLPIALLESLVFKKPIIATNVIGNKDVIEHGINGFLFNNINEIDDYIKRLEKTDFRLNMGEKAFEIAQKKFNSRINFLELIKVYQS